MLLHLSIKNFIIIRTLDLHFEAGLTVFTGETGAGKSIIIDAISLLCGTPSNESMIMENESQSIIEGVIDISRVAPLFKEWTAENETQITVTRVIKKSNRAIAKINGQTIPIKQLQELMKSVITIASQHEFTRFLDSKSQLFLLDQFLPLSTHKEITVYQTELQILKEIEKQIRDLNALSTDDSLTEFLKFQLEDIKKHDFKLNEEEELRDEKQKHKTAQKEHKDFITLQTDLTTAYNALTHAKPVISDLLSQYQESYLAAITTLEEMTHYIAKSMARPQRDRDINDIESRLDIIFKYKTKYKAPTLNDLIAKLDGIKTQIEVSENRENKLKEYESKKQLQTNQVLELAKEIHTERVQTAANVSQKITGILKDLNFDTGSCTIKTEWDESNIKESGCTKCTILIKPSEGQKEGPISEIASGGELSRIILAIRSCSVDLESPSMMIFDEIDTGVGGLTAIKIGEKIQYLSKKSQVICVTHLPQIAKFANIHFSVSKNTQKSPTEITARLLKKTEVTEELERMIGGKEMIKDLKRG